MFRGNKKERKNLSVPNDFVTHENTAIPTNLSVFMQTNYGNTLSRAGLSVTKQLPA